MLQNGAHGIGNCFRRVTGEVSETVTADFAENGNVSGYDRTAVPQTFDDRKTEPFGFRGHDDGCRVLIERY